MCMCMCASFFSLLTLHSSLFLADRITLSDAQLEGQLDLAGLTASVHDDRIASLVRDLQRTEQQLAALYSIHNQLSLGFPAILPSLDLTPPPATKVSLISAVGRFLAAALLRRPAAVQVDPRPAEEWRLERQREHAKVADQMKQLQVSIPGLAEIDLAELLAMCYAEERRSRGRGALALRRRIGNELWAERRRWEEQAQEQAGGGSKAADAKRIRFVYHKLTYWSSGGDIDNDADADTDASIAPGNTQHTFSGKRFVLTVNHLFLFLFLLPLQQGRRRADCCPVWTWTC